MLNPDPFVRFWLTITVFVLCILYGAGALGAEPTAKLTTQAKHILWTQLETNKVSKSRHNEVLCLAENIYFEARAESYSGKAAVGNVTRNRVLDTRWPSTYCEVVQQGPKRESWKTKQHEDLPDEERIYLPIRHMCQFSWYCDGKSDDPKDETGWAQAQYVAGAIMYSGKYRGITEGATHYHATYVKPKWRFDRGMNHIGRIGSHIFYRWD